MPLTKQNIDVLRAAESWVLDSDFEHNVHQIRCVVKVKNPFDKDALIEHSFVLDLDGPDSGVQVFENGIDVLRCTASFMRFTPEIESVFNFLRAGDILSLRWVVGDAPLALKNLGWTEDSVSIRVRRGDKMYQFLVGTRVAQMQGSNRYVTLVA